MSAITSGFFRKECFIYVDIKIDNNSFLWLKKGDILIQRSNSIDYVGTCALYDGEDNEFIYPDLMMKIKAQHEIIDVRFLYFTLSHSESRNYFKNNATGTAGNMPKINQKIVLDFPLKLPSLPEQQEIVRILDSLFEKDRRARELYDVIEKIDLMKKAILARAFRGELGTNEAGEESAVG